MYKQSIRSLYHINKRFISNTTVKYAKGDQSTIDSFRLPSQTSINEWEFKYDFIPKTSEPKVPPISKEAVKQDIAHEKAKAVERELFTKESNSSIKVEANDAKVLHGGEQVGAEPEYHEDKGSNPIDSSTANISTKKSKKSPNHNQYVQSSINPEINNANVVNLGDNEIDHKTEQVSKQSPIVEDIEHDNLHHEGQKAPEDPKSNNNGIYGILALLGLGGGGYWYYSSTQAKAKK
ncbi:uncharacterized protein KGF55_002789 [Candida pseudojiufengensis]|uniref:uncharacterized protein n=1 Tax=Candida pseudojiufengensis TaxID=497109 RepID=UPI002224586F|nr:uncharacterized protein KGF55_002789 [Candida pseudojiufengensis]KAI5962997.1 hypothetical protein KGF55_002789 [Candida pseudojiufengensis]